MIFGVDTDLVLISLKSNGLHAANARYFLTGCPLDSGTVLPDIGPV